MFFHVFAHFSFKQVSMKTYCTKNVIFKNIKKNMFKFFYTQLTQLNLTEFNSILLISARFHNSLHSSASW